MSEPDYKAMLLSVMAEFEERRLIGEEDGWWMPRDVVRWWEASQERANVIGILEAEAGYNDAVDIRSKLAEAEVAFLLEDQTSAMRPILASTTRSIAPSASRSATGNNRWPK